MTLTPPFSLTGEAGATLGAEGCLFSSLGITDAILTLRSLAPDTLKFSIRDNGNRAAIPDDGQWLTLRDDAGQVLFVGIAKRSYQYPARIYRYECANVYQGLDESALLGSDGRPYVIYSADDLKIRLRDILTRAAAEGIAISTPAADDMPEFYFVPKMGFRSASYASALEDVLKWVPDAATRMDYSTSPPTLRFYCRGQSTAATIDLYSDGHKTTSIDLTPLPEARALGVSFVYARREGDAGIVYMEQTAGDLTADSRRKISVYLSGQERGDMLISEALLTAQAAANKANEIITLQALALTSVAASAQIQLTFAGLKPLDSNLAAAVTAQSTFTMAPISGYVGLYRSISSGYPDPDDVGQNIYYTTGLALQTSGGSLATGWYPIKAGSFTDEQLATAGATKATRYIRGHLYCSSYSGTVPAGVQSIESSGADYITGYTDTHYDLGVSPSSYYRRFSFYYVNLTVDAINMAPSAVAAAVNAAAADGAASAFTSRADFVEAPEDLASNYFARQDWTPYKGSIALAPSAAYIPVPGDFINITGEHTPSEWASMAAPVSETEIDLATCAPRIGIGPSPSQDFTSLIDRLPIPAEDNYQPG